MKSSYCENCDKWLIDPNNENTIVGKCSDCGKKAYHGSVGSFCKFCHKEIDTKHTKSEWQQTKPNWKKVVVLEHEFNEKDQEWTVNHECKAKCEACEETKPIEKMLIGILFSCVPYCDNCAWKDMEKEREFYERLANSHYAESQRLYKRWLKLKNKFSNGNPSRERERERAELPNWNLKYSN